MSDSNPNPNEHLKEAIQQYCEELQSLHNSLIMVMTLLDILDKGKQDEIDAFIQKHGKNVKKEGDETTFTVELQHRAEWAKLSREKKNISSSKKLMPRNLIVALVCAYDSLLGKIIRFIFQAKPDILDSSERVLKYSELAGFSDIPAAREFLIEKEVESVLRKSHSEQFKWLESKLGTPFNKSLQSWPSFVELTERRNLFVHCAGIVSSQYLSVCIEHKCKIDESTKIGAQLGAPKEYFNNAYKCLYEIGIKLPQVIWRKLHKNELGPIDSNLMDVTYALIERGENDIAIRILEFFTQTQINHSDESAKRILIINLAQAYKWIGDADKCKSTLLSQDWSACEERFKIAVHVLNDDFEATYKSMRLLAHSETFHKIFYKEWPIFRKLRKEVAFLKVYEECYSEPFIIEEKVISKEIEPSPGNN